MANSTSSSSPPTDSPPPPSTTSPTLPPPSSEPPFPPPPSSSGSSSPPPPPPNQSPPSPPQSSSTPPPPSPSSSSPPPPSPLNSSPPSLNSPPPPNPPSSPPPSPPQTPPPPLQSNSSTSSTSPESSTQPTPPTSPPPPPPKNGTPIVPVTPTPSSFTPPKNYQPLELSPPSSLDTPMSPLLNNTVLPITRTPTRATPAIERSSSGNSGIGVILGLALAGVFVLVAFVFVVSRKKEKKLNSMERRHMPPTSSIRSEGYYYRQPMPFSGSHHSDSYNVPNTPMNHSSGGGGHSSDSFKGPRNYSGQYDHNGSKSWFSYEELADATHGYARENLLGEGGFGCVYKGWLQDGKCVAVKQLKAGSGQGEREFRAEVDIISRVHHRHLVSLVGYCIAENHRLLVYEFVPNGTLEHHLHGKGMPVMDWSKRMRIAIGSARGLAYLHEDCHPRIIHRDIKTANILLDNAFEAQVADFGLAKLSNDTNTHVSTRIMGTFGYLAPEYASSGKLTDRSDVYSFGVVLLEIITGRKPVDPSQPLGDESLVEWARPLLLHTLETGEFGQLVDPRLEGNFAINEMFRMIEVAAACTRHSAPKRPRMVQVVRALDCEGDGMDLSNGVKFGQSTVYDSGQYNSEIQRFRRMAFGSGGNSFEYNNSASHERRSSANSGEIYSRNGSSIKPPPHPSQFGYNSGEYNSSSENETHPMNVRGSGREGSYQYGGRGYS